MIPVSYDLPGAVEASGRTERMLREAIKAGRLIAHVEAEDRRGQKLVILRDDLEDYVRNLPVWTPPTT